MGAFDTQVRARRALLLMLPLLIPASFMARLMPAQVHRPDPDGGPDSDNNHDDPRLPNGKKQQDEILKADYAKDLKDAREMIDLAKSFELDLEKDDRFVLSVSSLKKLDDIEKLAKRLRSRLRKF